MFLHRSSQNYRVIMKENVAFLYRCVKLDVRPIKHDGLAKRVTSVARGMLFFQGNQMGKGQQQWINKKGDSSLNYYFKNEMSALLKP